MHPDSLLTGENAAFLDEQYAKWLHDPNSVPAAWRDLFASWDVPSNGHGYSPAASRRSRHLMAVAVSDVVPRTTSWSAGRMPAASSQ